MKAKDLIRMIENLNPNDDTDIELLVFDFDKELHDFLDIKNIVWNADCSGINSIGINLTLSHRLDK